MEIKTIKERLSITTVLEHYNLKPDRNHRLCCPFHPDKTPSLQIYPSTNTFCCFSSNCNAGTGDQIQFIELMEKCTRHEALMKATSLTATEGLTSTRERLPKSERASGEAELLAKEAVLTKWFSYYQKGLPKAEKAVDYLKSRCINY